jgi:hypothetical protein
MATASSGRTALEALYRKLPTPAETAAEIQAAARRLGLLIDLHRVAERLREFDREKSIPRSR